MGRVFACPECGERVLVPERATTRRVRCEECSTLVEVPFLPRAARPRRGPGGGWAGVVLALSLALIVVLGTYLVVRGRIRADRARAAEDLAAAAERDADEGRPDRALDRIDAALALAGGPRAEALRARRDELAAEAHRLELARAIESARSDLEAARAALDADPPRAAEALAAAVRAYGSAGRVPGATAEGLAEAARDLAADLAARRGVRIEPPPGPFLFGESAGAELAAELEALLAPRLAARGYLPPPAGSPLARLWDEPIPYRLAVEVVESHGEGYLQANAPNRTARLDGRLELFRDGRPTWNVRAVGRTRSPVPEMSAFASSRIGVGTRREPHVERLLYDDARRLFLARVATLLDGLPPLAGP